MSEMANRIYFVDQEIDFLSAKGGDWNSQGQLLSATKRVAPGSVWQ
jgi:hypothetical protein